MKKILLIIYTLFAFMVNANSQVLISTSDLKGTKWQHEGDYYKKNSSYSEFNEGEWISYDSYSGGTTFIYYLSNYIDTKFDYNKVGKNTSGRYLIQIYPQTGDMMCFSIKSFSKTNGEMVLITEHGGIYSGVTNTYFLMPIDSVKHPIVDGADNGW